ncbi:hypothetical protein CEXT_166111 [Caerostris extrusa]|uniref:Uncharacterized protein n=1 Tax=Caerostris extrusa TaxID=172846 RepID=A0AAV4QJZ8_CAEEX|nr:hypothetical protein CEXT_166111 [Caerostris extrusa]
MCGTAEDSYRAFAECILGKKWLINGRVLLFLLPKHRCDCQKTDVPAGEALVVVLRVDLEIVRCDHLPRIPNQTPADEKEITNGKKNTPIFTTCVSGMP